ncbi:MAG: hypothetical protein KF746_03205 [Chitinophagaceae bacterium]|nr:hypothetical protein [Chitinophagaceae bacterium]
MEENKLKTIGWANSYQAYLKLQKIGLRKAAFLELEKFILNFKMQERINRRKLIDLIYQLAEETGDYALYLPWNLHSNVFQPELLEWIKQEPTNPIPYKWSSDFSQLKKSIELNPSDQQALKMYYTRLINRIRLNQHEVEYGFGYSGDPQKDLKLIEEGELLINNINDSGEKEKNRISLEELKHIASSSIK